MNKFGTRLGKHFLNSSIAIINFRLNYAIKENVNCIDTDFLLITHLLKTGQQLFKRFKINLSKSTGHVHNSAQKFWLIYSLGFLLQRNQHPLENHLSFRRVYLQLAKVEQNRVIGIYAEN